MPETPLEAARQQIQALPRYSRHQVRCQTGPEVDIDRWIRAADLDRVLAALACEKALPTREEFLTNLQSADTYARQVVVEADGYPVTHSFAEARTIVTNAFLAGVRSARAVRGEAQLDEELSLIRQACIVDGQVPDQGTTLDMVRTIIRAGWRLVGERNELRAAEARAPEPPKEPR